jgi:DNA-binding CsgD family transcriptional regulator
LDAKWIANTAKLIGHVNDEQVFDHLTQFMVDKVDFQQLMVLLETPSGPVLLFEHIFGQYTHEELTKPYLDGAYLIDPFYLYAENRKEKEGMYHIIDVTPDGFYLSDFYKSYYADCGLLDELQYWQKVGDGLKVTVNISRTKEARFFTPEDIKKFKDLQPIVQAVVNSFWLANPNVTSTKDENRTDRVTMRERLNAALDNFGRSLLTDRECEVVRTILGGYTTKAAAQKLGISAETVHMHKKNIYTKLDISSQSEVFTLFLDAVAESNGALDCDPLLAHNEPA